MKHIYQHFRRNERKFIDQGLDWTRLVREQYAPYLTPFLNPREIKIMESIINQYEDLTYEASGGYELSERKRLMILPTLIPTDHLDFEITLLEVDYAKKFSSIGHGDILGAVMGLGVRRELIGDIVEEKSSRRWQFYADEKMKEFLKSHLTKVGLTSVSLQTIHHPNQVIHRDFAWEKEIVISSSLRLDTLLSSAIHISREKAKTAIKNNRVKVNWHEADRPDFEVAVGDILSVAQLGRLKLIDIQGKTKKDKFILEIGYLKRKR